ncbi:MAG: hypothetical protein AAB849_00905 [Patescibacteria group bacterium]
MIINEPEQIKEIPARLLATNAVWQSINILVESMKEAAVFNSDAAQIRRGLEIKLAEPDADMAVQEKYAPIILTCYFIGLYSLGPQARAELIQKQTLAALKSGIKVRAFLEDFLINVEDMISDKPELPELFKAYRKNREMLGGRSWQEWTQSYLASVKSSVIKRGAIERVHFINSDAVVKNLALEDKDLLLKALELLDWLEFPDEEKLKANWDMIVTMPDGSEQVMKKTEFDELNKKKLTFNSVPALKLAVPEESRPIFKSTPPPTPVMSVSTPPPLAPKSTQILPPKQPLPPTPVPTRQSPTPTKSVPQPIFAPTIERYDAVAEKLVKESGLNIVPELQQRFKMIVVSRLKEVRKWVETRQKLMSPKEAGGMSFSYEEAEKFLKMVDEKKEGLLKNEIALPADRQVAPLAPKEVLPIKENFPKDSSLAARNDNKAAATPRNDIKKTSSDITKTHPQPLKIVQQEKATPKIELAPLTQAHIKPAPKIAIPQTPSGRSKMEDVAYKPRLVGPVEELREMTIVDFRRLSPQVKVTADKIYAKIELLAEESYEKKIAGIKAWQESEVNKMYLGLLNESVDAAKPVQKMIEERQGAGRPTLTYEEFKTVMELNRRLRA